MDTQSNDGHWMAVVPNKLSEKDQNHCWLFAVYIQYPTKRADNRQYTAFLFRNNERTIYGLKEFWDWKYEDYRKMATKVIQDKGFRETLISDDPDLPKIWKRHERHTIGRSPNISDLAK